MANELARVKRAHVKTSLLLPSGNYLEVSRRPQLVDCFVSDFGRGRSPSGHCRQSIGAVIGLAGVMHLVDTPMDRSLHFQELTPVISLIEERFNEDLSMQEMAENAGLSSTQFNLRFRQILRMSPTEYLQKLRIETAQRLLVRSDKNIASISSEIGFYDQSHFTKRFRKITGLTPLAYRNRFRQSVKTYQKYQSLY